MSNKVFHNMYNLPKSGIFVFVNEKKRCVYISYSKNLVLTLSRNIYEMQNKVHLYRPLNYNIKKWKFSIIETIVDDSLLDIHCKLNFYINEYRNNGYEVKHHNVMILKFKVDIGEDYKVYCKLKARNGTEYVVGVFDNLQDSEEFQSLYRNMKVITPVYSNNDLTREFFK